MRFQTDEGLGSGWKHLANSSDRRRSDEGNTLERVD